MCGIGGIAARPGEQVSAEHAVTFSRVLEHRGPDDRGFLAFDGAVTLAREADALPGHAPLFFIHRRLTILDLSPTGWQPMGTPDGRYFIVYNGEIYNYLELRKELEALGRRFHSTSDTEVLLAAYAQWGREALTKLIGMFAFAILDAREHKLFLARDFFGIKPLHFCAWQHGFAFASEMKALVRLPGVSRAVDPEALYFYMRYGVIDGGESTLFAAIRQLPPGHTMEVSLDDPSRIKIERYWSLSWEENNEISYADAAARLRELFIENVLLHLRSDVPVGAALSGGIDSSAIVTAMRRIVGEKLDLHTFSYIADGELSEEKWIDMVTRRTGAVAHKVRLGPGDLLDDLPRLMVAQDQPFSTTSMYAQFRVFQLAREAGIKVMLDGQGADELLAGYRPFLAARLTTLLRRARLGEAARFFAAAARQPEVGRGFLLKSAAELLVPRSLQRPLRAAAGKELLPDWMNAAWFRERGVEARPLVASRRRDALRESLQTAATATTLPALLRYEDRNSMAHSVESRVPFLTPKLASFILSLPEAFLVDATGTSKSVFREAMRGIVPDEILDRRDKIGFITPERGWLAQLAPWIENLLSNGAAITPLNMPILRREVDAVGAGTKPFHNGIWRSLNLIAWVRTTGAEFQ